MSIAGARILLATSEGGGRLSLCLLRSLARAGARVTLGGDRHRGSAFHSRFVHDRLAYPDPAAEPDRFGDALLGAVRRGGFDLVFFVSDATRIALMDRWSELARHAAVLLPDPAAAALAQDKRRTLELARELGLRVPETHAPESEAELAAVASAIRYPCVLKPRSGAGGVETHILESPEALLHCYRRLPRTGDVVYDYRPLVQEYVPGAVHDLCALFRHGEPRVLQTQKRLRMRPPSGGRNVDGVTTDEPGLRALGVRLLAALAWHGPADVEFKRDGRDGEPTLMEINPRFWGAMELGVRAGVDFPVLAARLALEGDIEPVHDYRVGLRCRWIHWSDGWQFWNILRPGRDATTDFAWTDPMPHVFMLGHWLERRLSGAPLGPGTPRDAPPPAE